VIVLTESTYSSDLNPSDMSDWVLNYMGGTPLLSISGNSFRAVAPTASVVSSGSSAEEPTDFLGIAQQLGVHFLPLTWLPALNTVGRGATAEIRESYVNDQLEFAFKRLDLDALKPGQKCSLQPLMAELAILGQPSVRGHPNILTLEGISWDVRKGAGAWPVLVFRKSRCGDLANLMRRGAGKSLTQLERLDLCADIAEAIIVMHSNGELKTHYALG
jgi:hypothetical protein